MQRRAFLKWSVSAAVASVVPPFCAFAADGSSSSVTGIDPQLRADWLARWKDRIESDMRDRFCDRETGEEIGWLISPFLNGFYHSYKLTGDTIWVSRFVDWADSWLKRGTKDPSGYIGWPKAGDNIGQGGGLLTDSLLGEAMGFRPVVLMAREIQRSPALRQKYGARASAWLDLAAKTFEKWNTFDSWRDVPNGGLWVVPAFGLNPATNAWTEGFAERASSGFSNPDNKENHIARWMLAMHDVTGEAIYRERAEKWFRLMRSRMKLQQDGKYFVWNYWDPAGPWDYKPDGSTRHWVGVHPNGGYYGIDVETIVAAYEHHLVFTKDDLDKLIATNRDFMWNHDLQHAHFRRIDAGDPDPRWKDSPGTLWAPLVFYDATLRDIFLRNFDPASWEGISLTPWFLARTEGRL